LLSPLSLSCWRSGAGTDHSLLSVVMVTQWFLFVFPSGGKLCIGRHPRASSLAFDGPLSRKLRGNSLLSSQPYSSIVIFPFPMTNGRVRLGFFLFSFFFNVLVSFSFTLPQRILFGLGRPSFPLFFPLFFIARRRDSPPCMIFFQIEVLLLSPPPRSRDSYFFFLFSQ